MLDPDQSPERLDERLDGLEEALDELKDALNAQVGGEPDEESLNWEESERRPLVFWLDPIAKGTNDDAARTLFVNYVKTAWTNKTISPGHGDLLVAKRTFEIEDENGSPQDVDCLWLCFVTVADGAFQRPGDLANKGLAPLVKTDDNFSYVFFDTCHTGTVSVEEPDCDCSSFPLASSSETKATGDCYSFEVLTDISTQSGDSGEAIKLVPKKRVVKIDKCGNVAGIEAVTEDTPIPIPCCDEDPPEMTCQELKERAAGHTISNWEVYWSADAQNPAWNTCRISHGGQDWRPLTEHAGGPDVLAKIMPGLFQKDPVPYLSYGTTCTPTSQNGAFQLEWDSSNNKWTVSFPGTSGNISIDGCENLLGTKELVAGDKFYKFTIS